MSVSIKLKQVADLVRVDSRVVDFISSLSFFGSVEPNYSPYSESVIMFSIAISTCLSDRFMLLSLCSSEKVG